MPEDVDDGDPDEEDHHGEDQDLQHESVWWAEMMTLIAVMLMTMMAEVMAVVM